MQVHCAHDDVVLISELKLNPKNRNQHPKEQIERLAKVLNYQGWRYPIKISNRSRMVVSGHGRIEAALMNTWDKVPVCYQDYESDEQEYADSVSDNAIASWSELDLSGINVDIGDLGPFNIDFLGIENFTVEPLDKLDDLPDENESFNDQDSEEKIDENESIPEKIENRTQPYDHYKIGAHELYNGDCLEKLLNLENESIHALVTDPPAGISFMGKEWDEDKGGSKEWIQWLCRVMKQTFRVLKPGAHGLVWAIPRTSHWTATALEDAGFEIRDVVTHIFGSGFPKSMDISKAIDKQAGAEREVIGSIKRSIGDHHYENGSKMGRFGSQAGSYEIGENYITAPATPEAKQWQGWGTALKPASEHWILVRKPISAKTVAANVLEYGTGGINIDASRIRTTEDLGRFNSEGQNGWKNSSGGASAFAGIPIEQQGRFPANLVLSHNDDCYELATDDAGMRYLKRGDCTPGCAVAALDAQSLAGGMHSAGKARDKGNFSKSGLFDSAKTGAGHRLGDSGGASRFFYCSKPSKSEKNEGCEELPEKRKGQLGGAIEGKELDPVSARLLSQPMSNIHPTVKSLKLMTYLIKMVTPPGGILLDCFGGSGTTLVAAEINGFKSILFEQQIEYCDIILARAEKVTKQKAEILNG